MANGQPFTLGGVNTATLPTSVVTTTISSGSNRTALIGWGPPAGTGVYGTAMPRGPNLLSDDVGVFGFAQTTGVLGKGSGGMITESDGSIVIASAGVAGVCPQGIGVHGSSSAGFGVLGQDTNGTGVLGSATSGTGVVGQSVTGAGVSGRSGSSPGVSGSSQTAQGVFGTSVSSAGVVGLSTTGTGVRGRTTSGIGVIGESSQFMGVYGAADGQPGVRGDSTSNHGVMGMSTTGNGVMGWSLQGDAGVYGYSEKRNAIRAHTVSGFGVYADSATYVGVMGWQTGNVRAPGAGVVGRGESGFGVVAYSASGMALYAKANTNLAARFDGDVQVHGSLSVVGGAKSAVVRDRDGSHRQLYCMESPESWFEDFGEARLRGGIGKVKLDRHYAALIRTGEYQVFLTAYDAVQLYVHKRGREGFEVRALPTSERAPGATRFGYRIVARRKDIAAPRLARVSVSTPPAMPRIRRERAMRLPRQPKMAAAERSTPISSKKAAVPRPPRAPRVPSLRAPVRRRGG
jgi:hypothetical protein